MKSFRYLLGARRALIFGILLFGCSVVWAAGRGVVFLVPGTFNSLIPGNRALNPVSRVVENNPYFSSAVLGAVQNQRYYYDVIKNLSPFGDVDQNGAEVARQIRAWYSRYVPQHNRSITILGHSMGGAYALYALQYLRDLPIRNVVLVSTPLDGAPLANAFLNNSVSHAMIWAINHWSSGFFDFRGLAEATTLNMHRFLYSLKLPRQIRYYTVGSYELSPPNIFEIFRSEYLSPLFAFTALVHTGFSTGPTDGVVPLESALGEDTGLPFHPLPVIGHLDHAKQVLDYRILRDLGFSNTNFVRTEQARFYNAIFAALPQ